MKKIALALMMAAALPVCAADRVYEEFVKHWNTSREFTLAVAEAMPAEQYNFRPAAEEMSFGQLMLHIGAANAFYVTGAVGVKPMQMPAKVGEMRKDPKTEITKAEALEFLKASFAQCEKALGGISEENSAAVTGPEGRKSTGSEKLLSAFTHMAHHRGQAEVYLRVKGIKPPDYKF